MFYDGCRNFINSLFEQQYVTDSDDTATVRLFNVNSKNTIMLSLALVQCHRQLCSLVLEKSEPAKKQMFAIFKTNAPMMPKHCK